MKLTVIGAGNMGGALIKGWAKSGKISNITIADKNEALLAQFKQDYPAINITTDNIAAVKGADVIVLVVKPWLMKLVLAEVKHVLDLEKQIIISDAANFTTAMLAEELGQDGLFFYVIPNIAAEFAASMSFIAKGAGATDESLKTVEELYAIDGDTLVVGENLVGPGMMMASCGIAYVMRYIRAQMEGGCEMGFYPQQAKQIALQTMQGAVSLLKATGWHPEEAIDKVTTPGGANPNINTDLSGASQKKADTSIEENQGFSSKPDENKIKYNTEINKTQNTNNNNNNNINFSFESSVQIPFELPKEYLFHTTGLYNIGSTCYMNATLQCLANIRPVTESLLKPKKYIEMFHNQDICRLTLEYSQVLIGLFCDNSPIGSYKPEQFKATIGELNSLFQGVQANDSKDLIIFLLETLNSELVKLHIRTHNIIEKENEFNPNIDPTNEAMVFDEFRKEFTKNYYSAVGFNLCGFQKNIFKCQICGGVSNSFSILITILVPIITMTEE